MANTKPTGKVAEGSRIYLAYLTPAMATKTYADWLNDKAVNQYLEVRFDCPHTLAKVRDYAKSMYESPDNHLFAIMLKEGERHIGNIKVGPVNRHHLFAEVGLFIGDKSLWGKGFGTEAIQAATDYAFDVLKLHKLIAGAYSNNIGSIKAFEAAGYSQEALLKEKFVCDGKRVDHVIMGKISGK